MSMTKSEVEYILGQKGIKEVLCWNGDSFWDSDSRMLVQGSHRLMLETIENTDFEYYDIGTELSQIRII